MPRGASLTGRHTTATREPFQNFSAPDPRPRPTNRSTLSPEVLSRRTADPSWNLFAATQKTRSTIRKHAAEIPVYRSIVRRLGRGAKPAPWNVACRRRESSAGDRCEDDRIYVTVTRVRSRTQTLMRTRGDW